MIGFLVIGLYASSRPAASRRERLRFRRGQRLVWRRDTGRGDPGEECGDRSERNQVTDESGRFEAAALAVGRYVVRAEKAGFRSEEKTGFRWCSANENPWICVASGDVQQTVKVEAMPTVVAITTEDISGLVGERQVKELP